MDAKSSDSPDSAKAVNYALDTKFSSNDILGSKSKKSSGSFIVCSSSSKSSSPPMRSSRSFLSSPKLEPLEKRSVFISYNAGEPDVVEKVNILRKRLIAKDKVVFLNPVSCLV